MNWKRYRYGSRPAGVPLAPDTWTPTTEEIRAAKFDPRDEELTFCVLTEDFCGHPAGSRVITGLTCEGHPFAIEVTARKGKE